MFQELGAVGIDADELARQVVLPGSKGARQLREAFGSRFFDGEGNLDRKLMAEEVFGNPAARRTIESIVHPLIREAEKKLLEKISIENPGAVVIVEIPLLAEGGRAQEYTAVVLVTAPEGVRISRLVETGTYDFDEATARMASQAADEEREKLADWIVDNGGNTEETEKQVRKIYEILTESR
jgi:dephospho-CoA kinase